MIAAIEDRIKAEEMNLPLDEYLEKKEQIEAKRKREEKEFDVRKFRDLLLENIRWRVERYQTQAILGVETSDTEEEYKNVLSYIEALRHVPEQEGFPDNVEWPVLKESEETAE